MNLPVLIIPLMVGIIAQISKSFFTSDYSTFFKAKGISIPRYGGMPSAHTAFAFSLLTSALLFDGVFSTSAAIAVVITILILDDALRMRIFLEQHGQALTKLINRLPEDERADFPPLETRLGHRPVEVVVGAILGTVLTWVFFALLY